MGKTIFYDVDTQNDFMNKDGALYVPCAEELKPIITSITAYARNRGYTIMGSVDAHQPTDPEMQKVGGPFPEHCIKGTFGQKKIEETKPEFPIYIRNEPWSPIQKEAAKEVRFHVQHRGSEAYFEKQHYDVFTNMHFEDTLKLLEVDRAIVYGVATDYCVKAAAIGMAERGIEVYVLTDAIKAITPETEAKALEDMKQAGVKFTEFSGLEKILKTER